MNCSAILAKWSVRAMGRNLSNIGGWSFGTGTTMACFHCCGGVPSANDVLRTPQSGVLNSAAKRWTSLAGMPSGPADFPGFTLDSSLKTSRVVALGVVSPAGRMEDFAWPKGTCLLRHQQSAR